ncbi:glycosyl hydrolase [Prolixibacteraceae bacterium Z1-6]|uniref:Glycosyl hydrolase n=1 Tax=Draconibacterium aestuarii TaxID=2998507 RepID=A0A9X3F5J3_9BACT|nr:glycosyl hydrolase [Prolixibacteraceae bacterium Z1-6]
MKRKPNRKGYFILNMATAIAFLIAYFSTGCSNKKTKDRVNSLKANISESEFLSAPESDKPWVYYWWLKGNVTKEQITHDLEEMQKKGIGGFLLFDSRGYWDSYDGRTGHIPVPLQIKYEFMNPEWREMVKFTMQEANRLGLKMSINMANTGGSLRGPWDMEEDGPKQLIWTSSDISGPKTISVQLESLSDQMYYQDVALMAVKIKSDKKSAKNNDLNQGWETMVIPNEDAPVAGEIIDLNNQISNGTLQWDVPEGEWRIIRFGYHVIGEEGSVDILNPAAVTKYFHLMGSEILKDAGELAGNTLTHFYNVSWEGGQPNWTVNFENEFRNYRGYDIKQYMPILTGISLKEKSLNKRFIRDYMRTVSDCFRHNCYETIGKLCHDNNIKWHPEDGGPWPRIAPMFKEADQLTFWGSNDMPQGEFWCSGLEDLQTKSNMRYAAMAGHIHGHPLIAVEAFTHMGRHWTKYPAYLKPFADINLIDGANFFIWHTFTASPIEIGKPGYEYFAGTHINSNITWWNKAGSIMDYLGRSQYLLRKGNFVSDVCCYVSDKNYVRWGRGEKWNQNSSLNPVTGYSYDLLDSKVLLNDLSVRDGKLVLPDGMSYKLLVVDLEEPVIPADVLQKIKELTEEGATIVLGQTKPLNTPGINNYPESDEKIRILADELWTKTSEQMAIREVGKGKIYTGTDMKDILADNQILPDFEGPFEYIHRADENLDIYFISGEGKVKCTFRVNGKKPEIWDPVTGQTIEAISYHSTNDGRTNVSLQLPVNGSVFVVFREKAEENYFISVDGPGYPEVKSKEENVYELVLWESGEYYLTTNTGKKEKISTTVTPSIEITGDWNVTFIPATEAKEIETTFDKLTPWNKNPVPEIKYFSGTADYTNSFTITTEQAARPARLNLGEVLNIARIWVNGKDLGIVWTAPWSVDISDAIKEGNNELKIEVTNCWANRLIGDAGLPESQWTTRTNVRRVPDRSEYKAGHQAFSAEDELMPSGLVGPVKIEFGKEELVTLE